MTFSFSAQTAAEGVLALFIGFLLICVVGGLVDMGNKSFPNQPLWLRVLLPPAIIAGFIIAFLALAFLAGNAIHWLWGI